MLITRTFNITVEQAEKLKQEENQSEVVREALDLYYKGDNNEN